MVLLVLIAVAALGLGLELGRFWQRHEHRPHWDELARKDSRIDSLRRSLAAEKAAHRATARTADERFGRIRELSARLANRTGAA